MTKLIALTDYKGFFGSKHNAFPYRSGMDKDILKTYFNCLGVNIEFVNVGKIKLGETLIGDLYLYTSQEDPGYYYKSFIEDIVLGLELSGKTVVPSYSMLRANNNKVSMEIIRDILFSDKITSINSSYYGTLEDFIRDVDKHRFPLVIKGSGGAMGKNVFLVNDLFEAKNIIRKNFKSSTYYEELKEEVRSMVHHGYKKDSFFRKKFIVQEFIPELRNDWKIYVFGKRYYIFYRPIFTQRIFKASGGGYDNYSYGIESSFPDGIFDFANMVFNRLDVPNASLDIGFSNGTFYLFEFQCVYFGTAGLLNNYSKHYFKKENGKWSQYENDGNIEKIYAESIFDFFKKKSIL